MAYKIVKGACVWWPVLVPEPADGGEVARNEFEIRFKRVMSLEEAQRIGRLQDAEFILEAATDWRGIEDEDGPLAFNRETAAACMLLPNFGRAVAQAWYDMINAEPARRLGNFEPSPDGGPAQTPAPLPATAS